MELIEKKAVLIDVECVATAYSGGFDRYWSTLRSDPRLEDSLYAADWEVNPGPPHNRPHRLIWSWLTRPRDHLEIEKLAISLQLKNELDELQCRIDASYLTGDFCYFVERWFERRYFIVLSSFDLYSSQIEQLLEPSGLSKRVHMLKVRREADGTNKECLHEYVFFPVSALAGVQT